MLPRLRAVFARVRIPAFLSSVRTRIALLSIAPLTALLIVAATYWIGQGQVNAAIEKADRYSEISTEVERFRGQLAAMAASVAAPMKARPGSSTLPATSRATPVATNPSSRAVSDGLVEVGGSGCSSD